MRRRRKNTATPEKGDHIHIPYIRDAADVNLSLWVEKHNPSSYMLKNSKKLWSRFHLKMATPLQSLP